jgi:acetyl-CoA carboxylase carboxyl transferase subunit beta
MAWFKRQRKPIAASVEKPTRVPEGLWIKCPGCNEIIYNKDLAANAQVCPRCAHHHRLSAVERLRLLFDGAWEEHDRDLASTDPLGFVDTKPYKDRLATMRKTTGLKDAVITASGSIGGVDAEVAAMEYAFIGGSMGVVVGEKITRAIERAIQRRRAVVIVSCSGGARMMEGTLSLMQMAKVSAALARLDRARLPYVSILTDPTTGGVTASFAMLGDLNIAEPKALIGFAGPRVIEQTIRQKLPEGFQRSEFLLDKGMLDMVVDRRQLKATVAEALRFMSSGREAPPTPVDAPGGAARRASAASRPAEGAARAGSGATPPTMPGDSPKSGATPATMAADSPKSGAAAARPTA